MKLLVTGGAGFIGSNFVRHVLHERRFVQVLNYDLLTYAGNSENLQDIESDPRYRFVKGDITSVGLVDKVFEDFKPDAIVNFAAETHVDRSIHGGAADFVRTNVLGVQVLLEAVKKHKTTAFVHISTDEVFGAHPLDSGFPSVETDTFEPNSPYSASKAGGDLLCRAYFKTYGTPVMVTHAANNYGPYHFPEKIIPFFISKALADQPLPLYGDGKYVRDWLHVGDHCSAILAVLERGVFGGVYNIGADNERANIDIAKMILGILGKPETLLAYVADRPGHDRRYSLSSEKIRRELGWRPKYGSEMFEQGLKETVEWFLAHQDWTARAVERVKDINNHISL
ncbi:MAG: dTDP-glucose 4,6-dehydratase [Patescibacteria group bacterium]|jgi:dTDP-glucose 4,6-dehydratase